MTISALAPLARADAVAHAMLRETTSLGVRRYECTRASGRGAIVHVDTAVRRLPVKIARDRSAPRRSSRSSTRAPRPRAPTGSRCARCSARPSRPRGARGGASESDSHPDSDKLALLRATSL